MVELNPAEGIHTNVIGTRHIADAAHQYGALAMVQVSTDKAVNPTSVMGASKRLAEFYCQALDLVGNGHDGAVGLPSPRFMTVRFGNVLGSSGSVVPLFQRQLAHSGPLTVTHPEIRRYFMTVKEAVELVLQASAHGIGNPDERGRIFVLDRPSASARFSPSMGARRSSRSPPAACRTPSACANWSSSSAPERARLVRQARLPGRLRRTAPAAGVRRHAGRMAAARAPGQPRGTR
jgi:hypothetical protein